MYVVLTQILCILTFILGYIVGKRKIPRVIKVKRANNEEIPDPVSPADQALMRKLEEERRG